MPLYAYKAIEPASGRVIQSTMEGESEQSVAAKLREQSLHVADIKPAKISKASGLNKKKMKPKSLVVFSRQFATMIDAGIPILRCLDILQGQCKDPALKSCLEVVTVDVKGGMTLNEAMAKHPDVFSKLYVNMIKAAELGGILDVIL
ncbi:MAG TPA: type II secretion system F family protein, partial [Fimbriimonas sp.]|nr:type II secretion system F family protein [Fimbriimonas sp.]